MANEKKDWYLFHLNEDKDWVRARKVFTSIKEAQDYSFKHKYDYTIIQNQPALYDKGDHV